jgi:hypothetical protein
MIRTWAALALLAASWLPGLGYFEPVSWPAWAVMVTAAVLLLAGGKVTSGQWSVASGRNWRSPASLATDHRPLTTLSATLLALLPTVWLMPWPYKAVPLAIGVGLALGWAPIPRRWPTALGRGAIRAGLVLLAQSLAMMVYAGFTARWHDLPWPLAWLVGLIASTSGLDAALDQSTVAIYSLPEIHRFAATWELLVDPVSVCFLAGGLVILAASPGSCARGERTDATVGLPNRAFRTAGQASTGTQARWATTWWTRSAGVLALVLILWLPVRTGLLLTLYMHRVLRGDAATAMNQFFNPWVHLLLATGPVLLAWWFVRPPAGTVEEPSAEPEAAADPRAKKRLAAAAALVLEVVALVTFGILWDPAGVRKGGRVMVVERHSAWEPTSPHYDTTRYGEDPSYTYAAIYDYGTHYYQMSRLSESANIDDESLSQCDVLVIKTPTEPYRSDEAAAVARFVGRGGGLLMIGDHTNCDRWSTHLNAVARPFGFQFRYDILFPVGSPYVELIQPPAIPHPILQDVGPFHFAGTCSIDPGASLGRAVVLTTGKWSLPPDYHTENYFPQAEYRPDMRYGAFIQLWSTRYGRGRVLAIADSTLFSNFCTFEPGKSELMLGMLEWLNHRSLFDYWPVRLLFWLVLGLAALAGLGLAAWLVRGQSDVGRIANPSNAARIATPSGKQADPSDGFAIRPTGQPTPILLPLVSAGLLGWTLASLAVLAIDRAAMPPPQTVRGLTRVVVDRTASEVPLCLNGFTDESDKGYGLLEQWIPRLGYFPARRSGREAFSGNVLLILCPTRPTSDDYRHRLADYVAAGGRLLLIDSPESSGTTANSLLYRFGLVVKAAPGVQGELKSSGGWPAIPVQRTFEIEGGKPILWVGKTPVAAAVTFGKGSVLVLGCGSLLNDTGMGLRYNIAPDAKLLTRFDFLYALLRAAVTGQPLVSAPARPAAKAKSP